MSKYLKFLLIVVVTVTLSAILRALLDHYGCPAFDDFIKTFFEFSAGWFSYEVLKPKEAGATNV